MSGNGAGRLDQLIGAAAAVALEVEGDVRVADLLEGLGHFERQAVLQKVPHFGGADLDAGQVKCGVRSAEFPVAASATPLRIPNSGLRNSWWRTRTS